MVLQKRAKMQSESFRLKMGFDKVSGHNFVCEIVDGKQEEGRVTSFLLCPHRGTSRCKYVHNTLQPLQLTAYYSHHAEEIGSANYVIINCQVMKGISHTCCLSNQ